MHSFHKVFSVSPSHRKTTMSENLKSWKVTTQNLLKVIQISSSIYLFLIYSALIISSARNCFLVSALTAISIICLKFLIKRNKSQGSSLVKSLHVSSRRFSWISLKRGLTSMHRQLGSPFSFTAHSLPAPQNTLAHTFDLLWASCWKTPK